MPKLEPKAVQRELEQGWLWPVYWLHGSERMKSRELLKRIKKTAVGEGTAFGSVFGDEILDGTEVSAGSVLDAAQSMSLGGGVRFITVRDAHAIKDQDQLAALLGPRAKKEELSSVCVFLSKDLDGRKKFSKLLVDKAAVVLCEEIAEQEREAWIGYLAKRKGLELPTSVLPRLCTLEPWSLDIIDQELEKLSLFPEAMLEYGSAAAAPGSDEFLDAFFARDLAKAMAAAEALADRPDESLPLLGLIGWNVRHLAILLAERASGGRGSVKLNPYVAEKLGAWSRSWSLEETLRLQVALEELDFSLKQRPLLPLGLWDDLVFTFCSGR